MISFNLKLLPASGNANISNSNAHAEKVFNHIKGILGGQRCKKHPSARTIVDVIAVEGKDPKIEVENVCCQDFLNTINGR